MKAITTSLGFKNKAEDAAKFYVNAFSNVFGNKNGDSKVLATTHFGEEELAALSFLPEDIRPGPAGSVSTVRFQLIRNEKDRHRRSEASVRGTTIEQLET